MPDAHRPRRPAPLHVEPTAPGGPDEVPGRRAELADRIVDALLTVGKPDPQVALRRADELGLGQLEEAWSSAESGSRAALLWRLHLLRAWLCSQGVEAARIYRAGRLLAPVEDAIAGVPDAPTPAELAQVGDRLLLSAYSGALADAAERGAALLRVVASGQAGIGADRPDLIQALRARDSADVLIAGARACRHQPPGG